MESAVTAPIDERAHAGVSDQVRRRLRHPSSTARRTKAAPFTGERHQLVVATVAAAQTQKTVGENATFEECFEFVFDELGNTGPCRRFDLSEKGRGMLLNQPIQRGLFGTVAFAPNPSAMRQLTGLPANGLHIKSSRGLSLGASRAAPRGAIDLNAYFCAPTTTGLPAR